MRLSVINIKAISKNVIPAKLVLDLIGEQESISF